MDVCPADPTMGDFEIDVGGGEGLGMEFLENEGGGGDAGFVEADIAVEFVGGG